jgi:hypothetical protein
MIDRRRNLKRSLTAAVLAALVLTGCAGAAEPFRVRREQSVSMTATVKNVDQRTRLLVLEVGGGKQFTIHADEAVRNLAQVHAGDTVIVQYLESLAAEVRAPTEEEKTNPRSYIAVLERAALGDKPGAGGAQELRIVGTITAIDKGEQTVTLTDLAGGVLVVEARDPRNLDKVAVGDPIVLTYIEAVAVQVEPAQAR